MPETRRPRLLVISPAKDEARFIERTIASMVAQAHRPARWVIVDDGSTDETGAIAEAAAREHPWIQVVRRPVGARRVGPGVVEAFYDGLRQADCDDYDYLCKLDADLEFAPGYFAELLRRFEANPRLGTASGKAHIPVGGRFVLERTGDEFSHGVAKLYRRECFEAIGGFVREVMWDGIDCHRCRMLGWEAVSLDDPGLAIKHLRQMGSSFRSVYHGRLRWGRGQYFMGTHPLYLLGIAAYRMAERPWVLGGLCIVGGYLGAWARRRPRYDDPEFRRHLHRWQLAALRRRLFGSRARPAPAPMTPPRPREVAT
jgi:glycosyltransferase involved in cell wall biosynthesis